MDILYTAKVTATGGRHGSIRSDDGLLDLNELDADDFTRHILSKAENQSRHDEQISRYADWAPVFLYVLGWSLGLWAQMSGGSTPIE